MPKRFFKRCKSKDVEDFVVLRDRCLKKGVMFKDPDFNTDKCLKSSMQINNIKWRRPGKIVNNPQFFIDGPSRFDSNQGKLGDCWLIAAIATLTLNKKLFYQVVPNDQGFDDKYAGIFHFRFWRDYRWVDVVVDDRLPTNLVDRQLIFHHSTVKNEFWSALLEKAYAKLNGSYDFLDGGFTLKAMKDFTGGEAVDYCLWKPLPDDFFSKILNDFQQQSLMCGAIDEGGPKRTTHQGLVVNHAYSITCVTLLNKNKLLRLRNPWGDSKEWKGPWSDRSSEWTHISDSVKQSLGWTPNGDGEFWILYDDFIKYFSCLSVCYLNPDQRTTH